MTPSMGHNFDHALKKHCFGQWTRQGWYGSLLCTALPSVEQKNEFLKDLGQGNAPHQPFMNSFG